jgi:hypothetical protein
VAITPWSPSLRANEGTTMTDRPSHPDRIEPVRPPSADDELLENPTARPVSIDEAPLEIASPPRPVGPNPAVVLWSSLVVAWSRLDDTSKVVMGGSLAAVLILIFGVPFGVWSGADFVLIMLLATIATSATAGMARTWNQPMPVPLAVIELGAGAVAAVLAVANVIESLFDIDHPRGGIVGVVFAIGLAIAAGAIFFGALRRNGGWRAVLWTGDIWMRVALGGLGLVLIGWALNLSIGYWTMSAATLSLAVLTLAALVIVVSPRIEVPFSAAWVAVVLGAFAAFLTLELWGELGDLGRRVELSIVDFVPFLAYVVGMLAILVAGVLVALEQQGIKIGPPAGEPPPAAS